MTPPYVQSIPAISALQPHIEQQLVRDGNISGTSGASRSEAERRINELLNRDGVRNVDWHETQSNLDELQSDGKINENTYLELSNALGRRHDGKRDPPPWTGPVGFEDWDGS
jgi:hypothetical protein